MSMVMMIRNDGKAHLVVETPAVNETQLLAILIELHNSTEFELYSSTELELYQTFEYLPDPIFTNVEPRYHLIV